MDTLTPKVIKKLNALYGFGTEFFEFNEQGFTIKYKGLLKVFFDELKEDLKVGEELNETLFYKNFHYFRDLVLIKMGLDEVDYCPDNEMLYPNSYGLTNAPLFSFDKTIDETARYAFMYLQNYQVLDWVKELLRYEKVVFETFICNRQAL